MSYFDLFVMVLATYSVVDLWRNSDLFAGARMYVESWHDHPTAAPLYVRNPIGRFIVGALVCTYCFTFHASWAILAVWYAGQYGQFLITALAIERLTWLFHLILVENWPSNLASKRQERQAAEQVKMAEALAGINFAEECRKMAAERAAEEDARRQVVQMESDAMNSPQRKS